MRHAFSKHGGSLGEPGSVAYLFDKSGVIVVDADALRRGRPDRWRSTPAPRTSPVDDDVFEIITEPADLTAVRTALEEAGVEIESAELAQRPKSRCPSTRSQAAKLLRLIEALEENDDVNAVHANFDVAADVLERVAG